MPRDGSHIYSVPGGTDGVPDQPVYSTPYNGFVHDVEQDLNTPRPILAGGTAAINARDAMINLNGEISKQVVDNFDSFPFANGSWYCNGGATSAPNGNAFTGLYYEHGNTAYATVEARELLGSGIGRVFVRQKIAGVWGAWVSQVGPVTDLDAGLATKVSKTGDAMSGDLHISRSYAPTTGYIYFGGSPERYIGNDGSQMFINSALSLQGRLNSSDVVTGALYDNGALYVGYAGAVGGTMYFGSNATRYLTHNGASRFTLAGGELSVASNMLCAGQLSVAGNVMRMGAGEFGSGIYLTWDGTNWTLTPGRLNVGGVNASFIDTTNQVNFTQNMGGVIHNGGQVGFMIQSAGGGNDACMSFHNAGAYALNFGLSNALGQHLAVGGWSMGVNNVYKVWSSADFTGSAVGDVRLVYVGDYYHQINQGLTEPFGANCPVTGLSGFDNYINFAYTARYRQLQILTPGGWAGVGTA
jgi:hypothetical protein